VAKISITKVLRARRKVRILTVLLCAFVFAFAVWKIVINNPFGTKASAGCNTVDGVTTCTIDQPGKLAPMGNGEVFCTGDLAYDWAGQKATSCTTGQQTVISSGASVVIANTAAVTTYFTNTLKNLTIQSGGTVTHEPLAAADTSNQIFGKKVSIIATDYIRVEDGAKINADGKGYPGNATMATHSDGYPTYDTGGGHGGLGYQATNKFAWGGGGSSSVSTGGTASSYTSPSATTPTQFPSLSGSTLLHGASGGVACIDTTACFTGGNGGGYIHLEAPKVQIFPTAQITASGSAPNYTPTLIPAGGGAGGTIEIAGQGANGIVSYWPDLGDPAATIVPGGLSATAANSGNSGKFTNSLSFGLPLSNIFVGSMLNSLGGAAALSSWTGHMPAGGGGGAGGKVTLSGKYVPLCEINVASVKNTSGHYYIPAGCEGSDVIINGDITVYADDAKVLQNDSLDARTACTDPAITNCDSHRKFQSLTLSNNAKLTHNGVTIPEMISDDSNVNKSLADEVYGTARWKKVDIETAGDLIIKDTSNINVTGKGYPGGVFCNASGTGVCSTTLNAKAGYGPGGSFGGQWPWGAGTTNCGYGASYGSLGSAMKDCLTNLVDTSVAKYGDADLNLANKLEFGSGGGGLQVPAGTNSTLTGGSGGGRIKLLISGTLNLSPVNNPNVILANGGNGACYGATSPSCGAGGSGGSILIKSKFFSIPNTGVALGIEAGAPKMTTATPGSVSSDVYLPIFFQAKGGDGGLGGASQGGGGGAGRIMVKKLLLSSTPTLKKTLTAQKRGGVSNSSFDPYTLQKDDEIGVLVEVYGVEEPLVFRDSWLKSSNGSCQYVSNSGEFNLTSSPWPAGSDNADGYSLSLDSGMKDAGTGAILISYQCKVQ